MIKDKNDHLALIVSDVVFLCVHNVNELNHEIYDDWNNHSEIRVREFLLSKEFSII